MYTMTTIIIIIVPFDDISWDMILIVKCISVLCFFHCMIHPWQWRQPLRRPMIMNNMNKLRVDDESFDQCKERISLSQLKLKSPVTFRDCKIFSWNFLKARTKSNIFVPLIISSSIASNLKYVESLTICFRSGIDLRNRSPQSVQGFPWSLPILFTIALRKAVLFRCGTRRCCKIYQRTTQVESI